MCRYTRVTHQISDGVSVTQQLKTLEQAVASTRAQLTSMKASLLEVETRTASLQQQATEEDERYREAETKRRALLAANERAAQVRDIHIKSSQKFSTCFFIMNVVSVVCLRPQEAASAAAAAAEALASTRAEERACAGRLAASAEAAQWSEEEARKRESVCCRAGAALEALRVRCSASQEALQEVGATNSSIVAVRWEE